MNDYECSGRHESGNIDPEGCRLPAVSGFMVRQDRHVWLFCGVKHNHPSAKSLDVLVHELLGSPPKVNK